MLYRPLKSFGVFQTSKIWRAEKLHAESPYSPGGQSEPTSTDMEESLAVHAKGAVSDLSWSMCVISGASVCVGEIQFVGVYLGV